MLGSELRKAREKAGMSQKRLAFEAGVHRTYISLLERDKKSPTVNVLLRICKALIRLGMLILRCVFTIAAAFVSSAASRTNCKYLRTHKKHTPRTSRSLEMSVGLPA